jgi:hypothetical protein
MAKEILCGFGVDVDAVAGWLGSYGGEDSPDDISRGLFAGEVGSPRLLKLFGRLGIKTTWFIPGHSIETFPAEMKAVAEAGHEIGIHGYSHHWRGSLCFRRPRRIVSLDPLPVSPPDPRRCCAVPADRQHQGIPADLRIDQWRARHRDRGDQLLRLTSVAI